MIVLRQMNEKSPLNGNEVRRFYDDDVEIETNRIRNQKLTIKTQECCRSIDFEFETSDEGHHAIDHENFQIIVINRCSSLIGRNSFTDKANKE